MENFFFFFFWGGGIFSDQCRDPTCSGGLGRVSCNNKQICIFGLIKTVLLVGVHMYCTYHWQSEENKKRCFNSCVNLNIGTWKIPAPPPPPHNTHTHASYAYEYNTLSFTIPYRYIKCTVETRYKEIWYNKEFFSVPMKSVVLICNVMFIDNWYNKIPDITNIPIPRTSLYRLSTVPVFHIFTKPFHVEFLYCVLCGFRIQWNFVIKSSDITKPFYNKVICWSQGPCYNTVPLQRFEDVSHL